ncbi:MAG: cyclase family protein [Kiritimatiellae bacterium]|nr:cyclase family protein [Kiritimatiellia bacterium]
MKIVDLTLPVPETENGTATARLEERPIRMGAVAYTGMVYRFTHGSMAGTYIDFPGHIKETDDGADALNYALERLYRVRASVIRLDRQSGSGKISAGELAAACSESVSGGALILNALGARRFDAIAERSVYLGKDAVEWIIGRGVHLLISDVYESNADPQGVFQDLFAAGVSTVCCPVNLHELPAPAVTVTALPLRFARVTQLPCRVLAEVGGGGRLTIDD